MKFTDREKAIKKEKQYADKRFNELLLEVDKIDDPFDEVIEKELLELDQRWRNFCKNLIYISPNGKDEFIKVARERAFKTIEIDQNKN